MTWEPGRDRIAALLQATELQRVTPDNSVAQLLLEDAGRHLATAAAGLSSGDLSGAYQLAYDALRKSAASLLEVQGLRATSRAATSRSRMRPRPSSALRSARSGPSGVSAVPAIASNTRALTRRDPPRTTSATRSPPRRRLVTLP